MLARLTLFLFPVALCFSTLHHKNYDKSIYDFLQAEFYKTFCP